MTIIEISCVEVRRELSNYIESDIPPELRLRIEWHLAQCNGCRAVFDGVNNILQLVSTGEIFPLPDGFSRRLRQRLEARS